MSRSPLLIVAGLPELAAAAQGTGAFPRVVLANSVSELIASFSGLNQKVRPDDVVLFFADTLTEDNPNLPLVEVIRKLTGAGFHVVIVSTTARGADLSRQFPKAGLLPIPVRINDLLYAVNTFGFSVEPVQETATVAPAAAEQPRPRVETAAENGGWGTPGAGAGSGMPSDGSSSTAPSAGPTPSSGGTWGTAAPTRTPVAPVEPTGWGAVAPDRSYVPEEHRPPVGGTGPGVGRPPLFPTGGQPHTPGPVTQPPAQHQAYQPSPYAPGPGGVAPQPGTRPEPLAPTGAWGGAGLGPVAREGAYTAVPTPASRRGYVVTIGVSKGGTGKSSLTLNLGAFLGMRLRSLGKTVCVVDVNFQQADSGKYLDAFKPNINTIANDPSLMTRERILEGLVTKPEYNLSVLLGPATPDEGNPLNINSLLYNEILDLLKLHFDYILLDTPVAEKHHEMFEKFILPRSDYIVVPVTPNYPTLHNADNWLRDPVVVPRHAGGAGVDPSRIGIVLNRQEDGIGCSVEEVRMTMARWNFLGSIPETKEWKLANNRNELVAPKNYAELNQAFATVLYAATGEAVLMANIDAPERRGGIGGILDRIRGRSG